MPFCVRCEEEFRGRPARGRCPDTGGVRCRECASTDFLLNGWAWREEREALARSTPEERVAFYRARRVSPKEKEQS